MKVLIGEISSYKSIVIATYLKETYRDLFIITYDFHRSANYLRTRYSDKHYYLPVFSLAEYIESLARLCRDESIDLFFPVHSDYIGEIIKKKELFGQCFSYCSDYNTYINLHDKSTLHACAISLGIPVPFQYPDALSARIPFVAKPKNQSAAKGVCYVDSEKDRKRFLMLKKSEYLYQDYIPGTGCGYSVFAVQGKIIKGYGHKRICEFPVSGGSSIYRSGFFIEEMKLYTEKILSEYKWSGFLMMEFKILPSGNLVLIEANPRIWGSINQGLQNGVNYFEHLFTLEKKITIQTVRERDTYLSPHIYLSLVSYLIRGNLKPFKYFLKNFLRKKPDVSIFKDISGWLSIIARSFHL
jgi:hypothetical protein